MLMIGFCTVRARNVALAIMKMSRIEERSFPVKNAIRKIFGRKRLLTIISISFLYSVRIGSQNVELAIIKASIKACRQTVEVAILRMRRKLKLQIIVSRATSPANNAITRIPFKGLGCLER